jgi:Flp pilus assembly protein TadB
MRSGEAGGPLRRHRDLVIQVAVVVVVAAFLLPTAWVFAAVTVVFLLVLPAVLVVVALREGRRHRPGTQRAAD